MAKRRILCFGDSLTWGYIPGTDHERFAEDVRFPKVLQSLLGGDFEVIEEGLNSRTMVSEDTRPGKGGRNGSHYLIPCLDSHDPLDLVILMLGLNELKHEFQKSPEEVGTLLDKHFVKVILNRKSQFRNTRPKVLVVSLPVIDEKPEYASQRYIGGAGKSRRLKAIYANIAKTNDCYFVDASVLPVGEDGVHLAEGGHIELANRLNKKIRSLCW